MANPSDDLMCFACGPDNPVGLRLAFRDFANGAFGAEFAPRREHQGYKGIVHGGFLSLVLDEAMVACLHRDGVPAVSAALTVRLLKPVAPGDQLRVTAQHAAPEGDTVSATAEIQRLGDGALVARGRATCRLVADTADGAGHAPLIRS